MRKIGRAGVGVVLACVVASGIASCGSDRGEQGEQAQQDWETFKRDAERDLDAIESQVKAASSGVVGFDRSQLDRWTERVKEARKALARQEAGSPEQRRYYEGQIKQQIEEIKGEGNDLLAKLRMAAAAPKGATPPE